MATINVTLPPYNVVADGVTDCATGVTAAIAAAANDDKIYFPDAALGYFFSVTATISVAKNITFSCDTPGGAKITTNKTGTFTIFTVAAGNNATFRKFWWEHVIVGTSAGTPVGGATSAANATYDRCKFTGFATANGSGTYRFLCCYLGPGCRPTQSVLMTGCWLETHAGLTVNGLTGSNFVVGPNGFTESSIVVEGEPRNGTLSATTHTIIKNCTFIADPVVHAGFTGAFTVPSGSMVAGSILTFINCLFLNASDYGLYIASTAGRIQLINCAGYGNGSGLYGGTGTTVVEADGTITLLEDPCMDSTNPISTRRDYRLHPQRARALIAGGIGYQFLTNTATLHTPPVGAVQYYPCMPAGLNGGVN